jgi:PIN domain nuclease of toxin-antitoxin system
VELELEYLREIRRTPTRAETFLKELEARVGLLVVDISASRLCRTAAGISWTRDPFDRLIAAHATATGEVLVTSDEVMLRNLPLAWWAE